MSDCTNCKYATWDYEEYYGGYRQRFVDGCRKNADPETRFTKEYGWEWAYEAGADYWRELKDVLAWMPLPEPYKAESEEV